MPKKQEQVEYSPLTEQEIAIMKNTFNSPDGKQALKIIKRLSGIDNVTKFQQDSLSWSYDLGAANLYTKIEKSVNYGKSR